MIGDGAGTDAHEGVGGLFYILQKFQKFTRGRNLALLKPSIKRALRNSGTPAGRIVRQALHHETSDFLANSSINFDFRPIFHLLLALESSQKYRD